MRIKKETSVKHDALKLSLWFKDQLSVVLISGFGSAGQYVSCKGRISRLANSLVEDATVRAVNADKNVTGFMVAVNRSYKSQGETKQETAFVDFTY